MNIRQSGTSLIAWEGSEPVASVIWEPKPSGWYINAMHAHQPAFVWPLLTRFRQIWRASGRPSLEFHKRLQGGRYLRFVPRNYPEGARP